MKNELEQRTRNQNQASEEINGMVSFPLSSSVSKREIEILKHVAEGSTSEEIAEKLEVTLDTIETHRKSIIKKFAVKNMAHAMAHAFRNNLMQ